MDPQVTLISFSEKNSSESFSTNIDPTVFVNEDFLSHQPLPLEIKGGAPSLNKELIDSLFTEQDTLKDKVRDLVSKIVKPSVAVDSSRTTSSSSNSSTTYYQPVGKSQIYSIAVFVCRYVSKFTLSHFVLYTFTSAPSASYPSNNSGSGLVPPQRVPPVGNGDLNPFPLFIPSVPQPSYGTGNLVGPNHPIFGKLFISFQISIMFVSLSIVGHHSICMTVGDDPMGLRQPQPQGPFLPGLPQPRFDPFYPTVPGEIGPGIAAGRGGRGRGRMRIPGEPNPDHLRPPGFDGNDYDFT